MWGIFFGEFQCLPVDDCLAASCDSGVLAKGSESMSFYSAMLVPMKMLLPHKLENFRAVGQAGNSGTGADSSVLTWNFFFPLIEI